MLFFTGGFRDGNFNPRFDGPHPEDFFRGPGGPRMRPPMFNEGLGRFRGQRFDERNWDRPDADFENHIENPLPNTRQGRRSRWGHGDQDNEQGFEEEMSSEFNKGSATPVYDEFPQPEDTTVEKRQGHEDNECYEESEEFRGKNEHYESKNNATDERQGNFNKPQQDHFEENLSVMQEGSQNTHGENKDFQKDEDTFHGEHNYTESTDQGSENFAQDGDDNGQDGGINFQEDRDKHVEESCSNLQEQGSGSHEANTDNRESYQSHTDGNDMEPPTD